MYEALKMDQLKSIKSMLDLTGKKVLVTGGSGGIGRASAAALAELGADVVITGTSRSEERLKDYSRFMSEKYGVKVIYAICDVSEESDVKELFSLIKKEMGTIDIVFSNAGFFSRTDCADIPVEDFKKMMDVDVLGTLLVCREAANMMIADGHGGSLILNASMTGHIVNRREDGDRYNVAYPSAKAAILHLTRALALDYAQFGIRVNCVSPGYILSGIHDGRPLEYFEYTKENVPMKRYGTLDEIVGSVVYFASELSAYTTGADLLVDGGYCAW